MFITRRDIEDVYRHTDRGLRRARDPESSSSKVAGRLLATGEVQAGAFAVGLVTGRFGQVKLLGTPVDADLAVAIGGHLATYAFGKFLGSSRDHLHNVFDGVFAGWSTKLGAGVGTSMRMKAGLPPMMVSGDPNPPHGNMPYGSLASGETARSYGGMPTPGSGAELTPLTEAELIGMAHGLK